MKFDRRQRMNGLKLLGKMADDSAALVILDPQYREVLDAMNYGNEGSRQSARAQLRQMKSSEIIDFIGQIGRVLRPSGHLALWCDKFIIGEGLHVEYVNSSADLSRVDLIHCNMMTFGMGRRSRTGGEYVVIAQKAPIIAKGVWTDHSFSDCQIHKRDRRHPHSKPVDFTKKLILACTKPGDLVVDPAAGGYGVLEACRATKRRFIGCDIAG